MLPDLELGTVFEENGNGNEEEEESEGKGPKKGSDGDEGWNSTNHQPKRRHLVKVKVIMDVHIVQSRFSVFVVSVSVLFLGPLGPLAEALSVCP